MFQRFRFVVGVSVVVMLTGCSFQRSDDAQFAKKHMIGLSKEQVLICMGPPDKRTKVDSTEVWQYKSTDGSHSYGGTSYKDKASGITISNGGGSRSFCTVNIVMTNNEVSVVHYNGPTGGFMAPDEQCAYAIQHCVPEN